MRASYYISGFGLGTIKFLFAHSIVYGTAWKMDVSLNFWEIFLPPTLGALITMVFSYYTSEKLMRRAAQKRLDKIRKAIESGTLLKEKKKFTFINKLIVRVKRTLGIYGICILAPLFLSIPIGSIVCAKFYGHKKKTFPLMVTTVVSYSLLITTALLLFQTT